MARVGPQRHRKKKILAEKGFLKYTDIYFRLISHSTNYMHLYAFPCTAVIPQLQCFSLLQYYFNLSLYSSAPSSSDDMAFFQFGLDFTYILSLGCNL